MAKLSEEEKCTCKQPEPARPAHVSTSELSSPCDRLTDDADRIDIGTSTRRQSEYGSRWRLNESSACVEWNADTDFIFIYHDRTRNWRDLRENKTIAVSNNINEKCEGRQAAASMSIHG